MTEKQQENFEVHKVHFLIQDKLISLLALLIAFEFFDTTTSLSYLIQSIPEISEKVTPK